MSDWHKADIRCDAEQMSALRGKAEVDQLPFTNLDL